MNNEPFERYAEQLTWLAAEPSALTAHINEFGAARGWWLGDRSWQRRSVRFDPDRAPYCALLFESADAPQAFCHVQLYEAVPPQPVCAHERAGLLPLAPLGWLLLTAFPYDSGLPGLPASLRQLQDARVVRYRPGVRCTLRGTDSNGEAAFAKVFSGAQGAVVHAASEALWVAETRGDLDFRVAPPRRFDHAACTLWQGVVPGVPAKELLLGEQGVALAGKLGGALASVRTVTFDAPVEYDAAWQLERTARYAREINRRAPRLAACVDQLMASLQRQHAQLTPRARKSIHGAPHPQQWLIDAERPALVDFDRCGVGDAELDVATFVAEVDFERSAARPTDEINAAFVAGFEMAAGALDGARLALYRTHKHVAKALRLVRGVRVDAPARAAKVLQRCLVMARDGAS